MRLLARRAGIALDDPRLTALAADLGADVPVCLRGRSARVTGIGEDIEDLPAWPGLGIVLINPGRGLATPRVFAARGGDFRAPDPTARTVATAAGAAAFVRAGDNDLRLAAARLAPEIDAVLSLLKTAKARLAEGFVRQRRDLFRAVRGHRRGAPPSGTLAAPKTALVDPRRVGRWRLIPRRPTQVQSTEKSRRLGIAGGQGGQARRSRRAGERGGLTVMATGGHKVRRA